MTRTSGTLVAALGALALALTLTVLAQQGIAPDADRHERTLSALRSLTLGDAALQRDILRARAGLLGSYDPLVASVSNLQRAADALRSAGAAATGERRGEIGRRVQEVAAAVVEQEARVELFKSQNAILQNSLAYFSHLAHQLGAGVDVGDDAPVAGVSELANAMLGFTSGQRGGAAAADVSAALDHLARAAAPASQVRSTSTLIAHGRLIIHALPAVDDLVTGILAAPIGERARAVQDAYLDVHGEATARADRFRMLLYCAALLLVVYLGYLLLRLRTNADNLRSRLALEKLVASISTSFIDRPRDLIGSGIDTGLARIGRQTGVDSAALVFTEASGAARSHAWQRGDVRVAPGSPEQLLAIAADRSPSGLDDRVWIHVRDASALPEGRMRSWLLDRQIRTWLCIPMWGGGERTGFLCFGAQQVRRWQDDDIALLRTAAEIFANAVDRAQGEVDREELQARLAQAQRLEAVGTLAGGIAHEFNNVLGVILGSAEMALISPGATDPIRHRLFQIMKAGERAQSIVEQILAFSRRRERQHRPLRVGPAVAEALELLRTSLPSTVTLQTSIAVGGAAVRGDPTELQQIVMNLCTNAAHAMNGRGTIDVALDTVAVARDRLVSHGSLAAGPYVRLRVRDSGHGMDADTLGRIVEPFFTTKPVGRGTGLGLPTVHGIVTEHGGALHVDSRPGLGSTFEAYWPQSEAPADDGAAGAPVPQGDGQTVLLVDDESALVLLGEDMLAALGYEPVGFDSSPAALEAFRADPHRFDLVLVDAVMPDLTGSELAAALREVRPELPIVMMTGHPNALPLQRLSAAGIREVVAKPLRSAGLAHCLARHLQPRPGQPQAMRR